jgi:FkbM family methyltransferase
LRAAEVEWLLDVGANTGQFALDVFSRGYTGKIISFELSATAHAALSQRAKGNPRWEVASRCAIGSAEGFIQIDAADSCSPSLQPMRDAHLAAAPELACDRAETTPVRTLKDFLRERFAGRLPEFALKINARGCEKDVLQGLGDDIEKCVAVLVELPLAPVHEGAADLPAIFGHLQRLGFRCVGAAPGHRNPRTGDTIQVGGFFIRDAATRTPFEFKVFTSIPPRVDVEQQRAIIESWRANGFTPVSVNSPSEVDQIAAMGLDIEIEVVPTGGKPLIGEILLVIRRTNSAFAGIINADCRMIRYPYLAQSLQAGLRGSLLYAQRMETVDGDPTMVELCHGFDGFFFDVGVTEGITDARFRMGECWWDYWFPLRLGANGAKIARMPQPLLIHEKHDTNWSQADWQKYAEMFWEDLKIWHEGLSLPDQVSSRLSRRRMGEESGVIAMELYRWLRNQCGAAAPRLLPAEYGEIERLLHIDHLLTYPSDAPQNASGGALASAPAFAVMRGAVRFISAPHKIKSRVLRGFDVYRNHGTLHLVRKILQFGGR